MIEAADARMWVVDDEDEPPDYEDEWEREVLYWSWLLDLIATSTTIPDIAERAAAIASRGRSHVADACAAITVSAAADPYRVVGRLVPLASIAYTADVPCPATPALREASDRWLRDALEDPWPESIRDAFVLEQGGFVPPGTADRFIDAVEAQDFDPTELAGGHFWENYEFAPVAVHRLGRTLQLPDWVVHEARRSAAGKA